MKGRLFAQSCQPDTTVSVNSAGKVTGIQTGAFANVLFSEIIQSGMT